MCGRVYYHASFLVGGDCMKKKVAAVDICNTLADVNSIVELFFGKSENYPNKDIPTDFFQKNLWIFKEAVPLVGSVDYLNKLADTYSIVYVTARPIQAHTITEYWLKKHGYHEGQLYFVTKDKYGYLKSCELEPSIAFEDSPGECNIYIENGVNVHVPAYNYNQKLPGRFFSWSDLTI